MTDDWWRQAIGYQVYLPSFADSDGDGWGDLPGLVSRLDHLAWLGVDLLWVTPFYVSPLHDHGYDISDHTAVDPRFGRLSDVDTLITEAGRRGIRVIADLVVNHTSAAHPWFTASRADRDNPFRDHYIWRPGRGEHGELPPNNWVATFGGPAWTRDDATGEWYAHLFTPDQPDLNWANPKVADEVDAILRFWLDRGLAGFRVDTSHYLAKHPDLPDNPALPPELVRIGGGAVPDWHRYDHRYDIGQPALRGIHRRWRTLVDDYDAFLVGETHVLDPAVLAGFLEPQDGLHSNFFFGLMQDEPDRAAELLRAAASTTGHLTWTQSSHDWPRPVTRYGGGDPARLRALALTVLAAGLPGTLFLYQGEELGLPNGVVPPEAAQDPMVTLGDAHHASRDPVRTPMPWRPVPGLGFTTGTPWLPDGNRTAADTVEVQRADPTSWLHRYRQLIHLVRALPELRTEPVEWLDTPDKVVAYRRGSVLIAANLSHQPIDLELPPDNWALRLSTVDSQVPSTRLSPSEAVVLTGSA